MRRVVLAVIIALTMSGCSIGSLPMPTGFASDETEYGVDGISGMSLADAGATGDIISQDTLKRRARER